MAAMANPRIQFNLQALFSAITAFALATMLFKIAGAEFAAIPATAHIWPGRDILLFLLSLHGACTCLGLGIGFFIGHPVRYATQVAIIPVPFEAFLFLILLASYPLGR
jgi:hypothetical protein